MEFVSSGEEALRSMSLREFDAVVTDMRMPGMSGAELLEKVQEQWPKTVRIVLTGQADRDSVLKAIAPAHQFLSKPCDPGQLNLVLEKTLALTDLLENTSLKCFISRLKCVPSVPLLYQQLNKELQSEDPSASRLGEIIAEDMAMTAKLLQIVNSAAYGTRTQISEPKQAVMVLGLDTIQALVLSLGMFSSFNPDLLGARNAERLWEHTISVSKFSRVIAISQGVSGRDLDPYNSAGLLHDIGRLIMASADPENYRRLVESATTTCTRLDELELQKFGCTHAEVGAYLLGMWGLPTTIVEAVAWSHRPSASPVTDFTPLAAVHVASAFDTQQHPDCTYMDSHLDHDFLDRIGLGQRLEYWQQLCIEQASEGWPI
jgi:putative nucleotidyltransferase with HDIG domain